MSPHQPVSLLFRPYLAQAKYLAFRVPERIPASRVLGPRVAPPDWSTEITKLQGILKYFLGEAGSASKPQDHTLLAASYTCFVDKMEEELAAGADIKLKHKGHRSAYPTPVWKSAMLPPRPLKAGKEEELASANAVASSW
eukprot:8238156-Lingulodinium_polyedra.AAC.1